MKKIIILLASIVISAKVYTQTKDSLVNQTGFVFFSAYNFLYDTTRSGDLILISTFSDFFFPATGDINKKIRKNKDTLNFENGVRLYYFKNRQELLKQAKKYKCIVDTSLCYPFDKFYVLPVKIQYELTIHNDVPECGQYYYDIKTTKKRALHFPIHKKGIHIKSVMLNRKR